MTPELVCGICQKKGYAKVMRKKDVDLWTHYSIQKDVDYFFEILACPECSHLTPDQAFDAYLINVRKGLFPAYH